MDGSCATFAGIYRDSSQGCGLMLASNPECYFGAENQRQLGSQISMFQVPFEMGMPVRMGYIHAKFVITSAT